MLTFVRYTVEVNLTFALVDRCSFILEIRKSQDLAKDFGGTQNKAIEKKIYKSKKFSAI